MYETRNGFEGRKRRLKAGTGDFEQGAAINKLLANIISQNEQLPKFTTTSCIRREMVLKGEKGV